MKPSSLPLAVGLLAPFALAGLARADAVDDFVKAEMTRMHIPGLSLGIMRNGKLVEKRGYGLADLELSVPATADDAYEIGSITKSFTAIAAMTLVEEGKLSLDDPLSKYIPEAPEAWKPILVRHLLWQTSGLKDYALVPDIGIAEEYDRAKWMGEMTKLPLDFTPGLTWAYSNTNYALMGWVIEKAAGKPYPEFVTERLFQPAGMTKTVFGNKYQIIPRRSHGYYWSGREQLRMNLGGMSIDSDGTIISNVEDMAKWDAALREGKFLSPQGWKTVFSRGKLASGRERSYGMGWNLPLPTLPISYMGHGGNSVGYSAGFVRFPEKGVSVVILSNQYQVGGEPMARRIAEIYEPSLVPPIAKPASDPDKERTEKVRQALAAAGAQDVKSDLLDEEIKATFRTQRIAATGTNPFARLDELLFAAEIAAPGGKWLTYRFRKGERWSTVAVLWTPGGRLAQLGVRPDPAPAAPKAPGG